MGIYTGDYVCGEHFCSYCGCCLYCYSDCCNPCAVYEEDLEEWGINEDDEALY